MRTEERESPDTAAGETLESLREFRRILEQVCGMVERKRDLEPQRRHEILEGIARCLARVADAEREARSAAGSSPFRE